MWHWQHTKVSKHYVLWSKLFFLSVLGHSIIVLVLFFFSYVEVHPVHLKVTTHRPAMVLFAEASKSINAGVLYVQKQAINVQKNVIQKQQSQIVTKLGIKKNNAKKNNIIKKNTKITKNKKKAVKKQTLSKPVARKPVSKINKSDKKTVPDKKIVKKEEVKKNISKTLSAIPVPAAQLSVPIPVTPSTVSPVVPSEISPSQSLSSQSLPATMVLNTEVKGPEKYEQLRHELMNEWRPPIGIDKECVCVIRTVIGADGKASTFEMVESSGVLLFDMSVQSLCYTKQWPDWLYNQTFFCTFNN